MIIFDLDGTLIDSSEGIVMAVTFVLEKLELQIKNGMDIFQFIGPPLKEQFIKACGLTDIQAQVASDVFVDYYEKNCLGMFTVYERVERVLIELQKKRIEMAIATYKPENQTKSILNNCNLDKYFMYVACAEKASGISKSQLVSECIRKSCVKTDDNIYVGDTIGDEKAAESCGVTFIAAGYGFEKGIFLPTTKVIRKFDEILTMI